MYRRELTTLGTVVPRRNPFELWIVLACAAIGLVALLPLGSRNGVVDRYLPALALPWYVGLLIGGCLAAVGVIWRGHSVRSLMRALGCERVGLVLLCGLMSGYGGALVVTALRAPTGLLMIGLAVASAIRVRQITREVQAIENAVRSMWNEDDTG